MPDATPAVHTSNVFGSPGSTVLGIGLAAQAVGQGLMAGGVPVNASGWFQLFLGAFAVFLR